jgi:hypothetical protein
MFAWRLKENPMDDPNGQHADLRDLTPTKPAGSDADTGAIASGAQAEESPAGPLPDLVVTPTVIVSFQDVQCNYTLINGADMPHLIATQRILDKLADDALSVSSPKSIDDLIEEWGEVFAQAQRAVALSYVPGDVGVTAYGDPVSYVDLVSAAMSIRVRVEYDLRRPMMQADVAAMAQANDLDNQIRAQQAANPKNRILRV